MPTSQISSYSLSHLLLGMRPTTPYGIPLDALIQTRTVAGKMKNLDQILMPLQPLFHPYGLMNRVPIQNRITPSLSLANQTPKKIQKDLGDELPSSRYFLSRLRIA